ncbi:restriction endonuclease subunit S [Pedobacter caeni]|uniref:Type I restriction modification DNA specificity domain-containing protein n=1 Tax=Pedobacter caeni TaxID=288992 RepID=A0A1M5KUJ9_9SPHI|nr:restriction endonuclease subunit S [Pedobacter caeni]SHG56474.1 Type I restriction modification DNA specificity domain-containing protein [Pedobacter caeni]
MKNWITVKLGDLLLESKINSDNPDPNKRLRVRLNIGGIEKRPEIIDKEGATKYFIRKAGQFIFGAQNLHKGAFGIIPPELNDFESSSDIPAFDVHDSCYPEWIFYFFKQGNFYLKLEQFTKGIGSKRINRKLLFDLNIYLPPKEEQKRILDSIGNIEKKLVECKREFSYQIDLIHDLKASSILEGVKGELTKEWRKSNKPKESGYDLLKRIFNQKTNKPSKQKEDLFSSSTGITLSEPLYNIPTTWAWATLDDISDFISSGSRDWAQYYSNQGAIFVRMGNLSKESFKLRMENIQHVLPPLDGEGTRTRLQAWDYLISITGEVGLLGLIPEEFGEAYINQHIALVRLSEIIRNKYIGYFLLSTVARSQFSEPNRGIKNSFRLSDIRSIKIPIPSLEEQVVISEKIESLIVYFDQLEGYIKNNIIDIEHLSLSHIEELIGNPNEGIRLVTFEGLNENKINLFDEPHTSSEVKTEMNMKLEELLKKNGKMSAVNLWKMSEYSDSIDKFYEELKKLVEVEKKIIESEKGYLELTK